MENVNICDMVLKKKMDEYKNDLNNYQAASEIMVTITLSEYRTLVEHDATARQRIEAANDDKYSRESENSNLKKEIAGLKAENYELKKQLETLSNKKEEEDDDE